MGVNEHFESIFNAVMCHLKGFETASENLSVLDTCHGYKLLMMADSRSDTKPSGGPDRLLLVDDNPTNLQVLYQTLSGLDCRLLVAKSGEDALSIAAKAKPALILLDIMMPGIDGYEVCRRLKGNAQTADAAIIFLSALDDTKDKVKGLDLGAVDYITKPFQADEVIARVQTHLKIQRLEADLSQRNASLRAANKRMKEDLQAAARVQRSLLPNTHPSIEGLDVAWSYRPCEELGGDGLNVFQIDKDHVGIYVLDVSGHGVPAALLAVTLMHRLSAGISRPCAFLTTPDQEAENKHRLLSPAEVARRLNLLYPMDFENRLYFTFLYGVFDLETREFRYVSAGNPGPVLLRPNDGVCIYDAPAVPIGLLEDSVYKNSLLELMPGDRLYLHSDGLVDERNSAGEIYGRERLKAAISETRSMEPQASLDYCVNDVISWSGSESLRDDVSMIVVQVENT